LLSENEFDYELVFQPVKRASSQFLPIDFSALKAQRMRVPVI
jgi:hypothetical protein